MLCGRRAITGRTAAFAVSSLFSGFLGKLCRGWAVVGQEFDVDRVPVEVQRLNAYRRRLTARAATGR